MELRVIRNCERGHYQKLHGRILQIIEEAGQTADFTEKRYYLYDVDNGTRTELLPGLHKYDFIKINDCIMDSEYAYFVIMEESNRETTHFSLIRYHIDSGEYSIIYQWEDHLYEYEEDKKCTIFIADINYILIQFEYLQENEDSEYEYILYDISTKKSTPVLMDFILSDGLDVILPYSKNMCVLKTGKANGNNNLYLINIKEMISDMLLNKDDIYREKLIETASDESVSFIKNYKNYIMIKKKSRESDNEEIIFYNYLTKEAKVCKSTFGIMGYIAKDMPYVVYNKKDSTEVYDVDSKKTAASFDSNVDVRYICDGFLVAARHSQKGLLKKECDYTYVYTFNEENTGASKAVFSEKAEYIESIYIDENLYVFLQ